MTKEEMIALEIDKYTGLQRILQADESWRTELENQMMKARAKLESFGIPVETLTMKAANKGTN